MRFRPFSRYVTFLVIALTLALPARAVIPEKDYEATLTTLLQELRQSYSSALASDSLLVNNDQRREEISEMIKSADDVTIML